MSELDEMRTFFDRLAPEWDQHTDHNPEKIRALLGIACPTRGGRFLDVACGTGVLFPFLLAYEPTLLRALDLSPEMVRLARKKWNDPRISVDARDFYQFDEIGFDLITVYSAYPHFTDRAAFAQAAHRILKPGGRLLIAHSQSRQAINRHHSGGEAEHLSEGLREIPQERTPLEPLFHIDLTADTQELYLLSGTAK